MKIKQFIFDVRLWVLAIITFGGIGLGITGWVKIPARVDKVEVKTKETENNMQKLAGSLDKYIAVQESRWDSEREHKVLMLELIKEMKDK